jgi:flavin reductase (DIM6/NTAB) family NADH-FMN oxidoreductase RutF
MTEEFMSFDQRDFRNAVGCFATGVTIMTTLDRDGNKIGITANSFTSLSLDPPLVLFCVDNRINSFEAFESCRHFNINVLCEGQMDLSNRFARSTGEKWDGVEHGYGENGCPMFSDVAAVLECDKHAMYEGGDHLIVVGKVTKLDYVNDLQRPLLYYRGSYAKLA